MCRCGLTSRIPCIWDVNKYMCACINCRRFLIVNLPISTITPSIRLSVCREWRPVMSRDGILVLEGCRVRYFSFPTHNFGYYLEQTGGRRDVIRSIGWPCHALAQITISVDEYFKTKYNTRKIHRGNISYISNVYALEGDG